MNKEITLVAAITGVLLYCKLSMIYYYHFFTTMKSATSYKPFPAQQNCSLQNINKYLLDNSAFPAHGHWKDINNTNKVHYASNFCKLLPPRFIKRYINLYMKIARPRKVVSIGDSQARQYVDSFLQFLKGSAGYHAVLYNKGGTDN